MYSTRNATIAFDFLSNQFSHVLQFEEAEVDEVVSVGVDQVLEAQDHRVVPLAATEVVDSARKNFFT